MQITGIFIYPVKSLKGIALDSAKVEKRGFQYDRRWMIVDQKGVFISQREIPEMALLAPEIKDNQLFIHHPTKSLTPLAISLEPAADAESIQVQIWDDSCQALLVSDAANQWLSATLQTPCRLVYMPDESLRSTDPKYSQATDIVSFADGYPMLIIGEASLADLNQRLKTPVPMNRFRPNVVFSGGAPYEEDTWKNFQIGESSFRGTKPCGRCIMTTINQETAERGSEPLKTLSSYRLQDKKILFGMNVCWNVEAGKEVIIKKGDLIKVLK